MKVLVTGSRAFTRRPVLDAALAETLKVARERGDVLIVIHGGEKGADAMAADWARARERDNVWAWRCPAAWNLYGRAAVPIRNYDMLLQTQPDVVLAFPIGEALVTRNCIATARDQARERPGELEVRVFEDAGRSR